jgi:hypothetical protein
MDLSEITRQNLLYFNNEYEKNSKIFNNKRILREDEERISNLNDYYNSLIVKGDSTKSPTIKKQTKNCSNIFKELNNNKDKIEIKYISDVSFIDDHTFISKMMQFRRLEIKRRLEIIKLLFEQYKYEITMSFLYSKRDVDIHSAENNKILSSNLSYIEEQIKKFLRESGVFLQTTICKYNILNACYVKFSEKKKESIL